MKHCNRFFALLAACLCLLPAGAVFAEEAPQETTPAGWQADILLEGSGEYKDIELGADIYNNAKPGLANLRVRDDEGNYTPYFLYDMTSKTIAENTSFTGKLADRFTENRDTYLDFQIEKTENADVYGNTLILHTDADGFAKDIEVLGSHDGIQWTHVAQSLIYRVDESMQTTVEFGKMQKYSWYRLKIPNNQEQVEIAAVELLYRNETQQYEGFMKTITPAFTQEEDGTDTVLTIPAQEMQNLKLLSIELSTDSMFSRTVEAPGVRERLYNLTFEDHTLQRTDLELSGAAYTGGDYVIRIQNNDDAPIKVDKITAAYACDRLVFKAEPGRSYELLLLYGEKQKPVYDIASYADHILAGKLDACIYGPVTPIGTVEEEPEPQKISDSLVFQISLGAASLLLIFLIVKTALRRKQDSETE